jgi:hypothetical protein
MHAEARLAMFFNQTIAKQVNMRINYLGVYHRNVFSVLWTLGYVFIHVHLTFINVGSTAAF